jgi:hypothetical protein
MRAIEAMLAVVALSPGLQRARTALSIQTGKGLVRIRNGWSARHGVAAYRGAVRTAARPAGRHREPARRVGRDRCPGVARADPDGHLFDRRHRGASSSEKS